MREQLLELMERRGLGAIVMRRPENFAWYTRGGNSRVEYAAPEGVADVVVSAAGEWVLTSSIEAPRMRAEEARGFEVVEYPWEQGPAAALRELTGDSPLGADVQLDGAELWPSSSRRGVACWTPRRSSAYAAWARSSPTRSTRRPGARARDRPSTTRPPSWPTPAARAGSCHRAARRHPRAHRPPPPSAAHRGAARAAGHARGLGPARRPLRQPHAHGLARRARPGDRAPPGRLRRDPRAHARGGDRPGRTLAEAFAGVQRLYAEAGFPTSGVATTRAASPATPRAR